MRGFASFPVRQRKAVAPRKRFLDDERGAVAVYVGMISTVLIGFAGLAIDVSRLSALQTQLQIGADQTALAGAAELDGASDAVTRACRAVFGESSASLNPLTANTETFSQYNTIDVAQVRFLKSLPSDPTPGSTNPIVCDATRTAANCTSSLSGASGANCATSPGEARFIEVTVAPRTIGLSLIATVRMYAPTAPVTAQTQAIAVAGFTQVACKVPPLMICNPTENAGGGGDFTMAVGQQVRLKGGGNAPGTWVPGDFGLLDLPSGSQATKDLVEALASANPATCYSNNVSPKPGNVSPTANGLNVRFDIYRNPDASGYKGDNTYRPAKNVTRGAFGSSSQTDYLANRDSLPNQWTAPAGKGKGAPPPGPPVTAPLPRDNNLYSDPDLRLGTGAWDHATYWNLAHHETWASRFPSGLSGAVDPANPTRHEVYNYEVAQGYANEANVNGLPNYTCTSGGSRVQCPNETDRHRSSDSGGENGNAANFCTSPTNCPQAAGLTDDPDRRILIVAVINCIENGINGNSTNAPVLKWARFFMTEHVSNPSNPILYGEFVGVENQGSGVEGVLHDVVQLYR